MTSLLNRTVTDIKYLENVGTVQFTVPGGSGRNVVSLGYVAFPDTPSGYIELMRWVTVNGDSAVLPVGMNSSWVQNTRSGDSNTLTAKAGKICIKFS